MTRRLPTTPVEPGQVRRDPDPRHKGARTVAVQIVDGRFTRILTNAIAKWPLVTPSETTP